MRPKPRKQIKPSKTTRQKQLHEKCGLNHTQSQAETRMDFIGEPACRA